MTQEEIEILERDAIAFFGERHQVIKCIEELSELIQTLSKWLNENDPSQKNEISCWANEELADVTITLGQMKHIFDAHKSEKIAEYKRMRLKRIIFLSKNKKKGN